MAPYTTCIRCSVVVQVAAMHKHGGTDEHPIKGRHRMPFVCLSYPILCTVPPWLPLTRTNPSFFRHRVSPPSSPCWWKWFILAQAARLTILAQKCRSDAASMSHPPGNDLCVGKEVPGRGIKRELHAFPFMWISMQWEVKVGIFWFLT